MKNNLTVHQNLALKEAKIITNNIGAIIKSYLEGNYSIAQFDNDTRRYLKALAEKLDHIEQNDGIH